MTLYQELKQYEKELTLWDKGKVVPRDVHVRRQLFRLYQEHDNSVRLTSMGCSKCTAIYMSRLANKYFELKEHYKARRAGGK